MNNSPRGANTWAVITLILGSLIAFPFFKKSKPDKADLGASPSSYQQQADQFIAQRMVAGSPPETHDPQFAADTEAIISELLDKQLAHKPTKVALPEWATPASNLDTLMRQGAASLASADTSKALPGLPTFTNKLPQDASAASEQYSNLQQYAASPWENGNKVHQPTKASSPRWSEHDLSPDQLDTTYQESLRYAQVERGVGALASGNAGTKGQGAIEYQLPAKFEQQAEDKKRRFVYQPGLRLPED